MSRLTPFSRFLITLLIVGGIFFGVRQFFPQLTEKFGKKETTETSNNGTSSNGDANATPSNTTSSTSSNSASSTTATTTANRPRFDYTAPVPNGGKLKGVVELGASGFNSFIVKIDAQKNWKLEKADFGASLVYEKLTSDEDVKNGLKNYISNMLSFGVSPRDIHFVISSGAQKVEITKKITDYLKTMGYVVNLVTAEQEGKLGYKSVMPKDYEGDAYVVDIGSGNTKIAWSDGARLSSVEGSGAKYFQNNMSDDAVYSEIKTKAEKVPFPKRKVCFIIGGVPFELAKQVRNGKERYTVLNAPSAYAAKDAKTKAGLNIYKALSDGTNTQQFVFDWDANFTIGFLLGLPN
ncbi:MAG: hypothetical protein JNL70_08745 [Saprospiraceae bacterium]|nr:hypothetical protein [Saprospiraceae bacterium]